MEYNFFDVIIVGAGPAGCSCAYKLSGNGLKIAILEKDIFPRDKICGDALSADVINQLYNIDHALGQKFLEDVPKKASHGIRFFAPNHQFLDIDFTNPIHPGAAGYIAKRKDFDAFYFNQVKNLPDISVFPKHRVEQLESLEDEVRVKTDRASFQGKIVVGADGANSIVNRKLTRNKIERDHFCAGVRQYVENVADIHEKNYIELHFYQDILPGYFWIFPLPENQANIGLGILSSEISRRRIDLKEKLIDIINNHPNVRQRFKHVKPLESTKGFGLPIGSKKRPCSGHRFLLLGDAASLIDPFTGEGIGNAIRSGRIAAAHIINAFRQDSFGADFNALYDREIYANMWKELRVSRSMQKLLRYPKIFNFLIQKANKSVSVRMLLTSMLDNIDLKKELLKPAFYLHLIFNKRSDWKRIK